MSKSFKYVSEFSFPSDKGFSGSAGKTSVKGYSRGGPMKKADGGQVMGAPTPQQAPRPQPQQAQQASRPNVLPVNPQSQPATALRAPVGARARRIAERQRQENSAMQNRQMPAPTQQPQNKPVGALQQVAQQTQQPSRPNVLPVNPQSQPAQQPLQQPQTQQPKQSPLGQIATQGGQGRPQTQPVNPGRDVVMEREPIFGPDGRVTGYKPLTGTNPVGGRGGLGGLSPQMTNWGASNPNSPFLPNDAPNPSYNGPPVAGRGGMGGGPNGSPIGTGGQGRPVGGNDRWAGTPYAGTAGPGVDFTRMVQGPPVADGTFGYNPNEGMPNFGLNQQQFDPQEFFRQLQNRQPQTEQVGGFPASQEKPMTQQIPGVTPQYKKGGAVKSPKAVAGALKAQPAPQPKSDMLYSKKEVTATNKLPNRKWYPTDRKTPLVNMAKGGAAKVGKVMGEFKEGTLHSGSKSGPLVKSRKQAIAIGLSEARNAGKK